MQKQKQTKKKKTKKKKKTNKHKTKQNKKLFLTFSANCTNENS